MEYDVKHADKKAHKVGRPWSLHDPEPQPTLPFKLGTTTEVLEHERRNFEVLPLGVFVANSETSSLIAYEGDIRDPASYLKSYQKTRDSSTLKIAHRASRHSLSGSSADTTSYSYYRELANERDFFQKALDAVELYTWVQDCFTKGRDVYFIVGEEGSRYPESSSVLPKPLRYQIRAVHYDSGAGPYPKRQVFLKSSGSKTQVQRQRMILRDTASIHELTDLELRNTSNHGASSTLSRQQNSPAFSKGLPDLSNEARRFLPLMGFRAMYRHEVMKKSWIHWIERLIDATELHFSYAHDTTIATSEFSNHLDQWADELAYDMLSWLAGMSSLDLKKIREWIKIVLLLLRQARDKTVSFLGAGERSIEALYQTRRLFEKRDHDSEAASNGKDLCFLLLHPELTRSKQSKTYETLDKLLASSVKEYEAISHVQVFNGRTSSQTTEPSEAEVEQLKKVINSSYTSTPIEKVQWILRADPGFIDSSIIDSEPQFDGSVIDKFDALFDSQYYLTPQNDFSEDLDELLNPEAPPRTRSPKAQTTAISRLNPSPNRNHRQLHGKSNTFSSEVCDSLKIFTKSLVYDIRHYLGPSIIPLWPDTIRVLWQCDCGDLLFEDFPPHRRLTAETFQRDLLNAGYAIAKDGPFEPNDSEQHNSRPRTHFLHTTSFNSDDSGSESQSQPYLDKGKQRRYHFDKATQTSRLDEEDDEPDVDFDRWVLSCVPAGITPSTAFYPIHIELNGQKIDDAEMFKAIRDEYHARSSWFRRNLLWKDADHISLEKFQVYINPLKDEQNDSISESSALQSSVGDSLAGDDLRNGEDRPPRDHPNNLSSTEDTNQVAFVEADDWPPPPNCDLEGWMPKPRHECPDVSNEYLILLWRSRCRVHTQRAKYIRSCVIGLLSLVKLPISIIGYLFHLTKTAVSSPEIVELRRVTHALTSIRPVSVPVDLEGIPAGVDLDPSAISAAEQGSSSTGRPKQPHTKGSRNPPRAGKRVYQELPKKIRQQLHADPNNTTYGWGVVVQEGTHVPIYVWWSFGILLVVTVLALVSLLVLSLFFLVTRHTYNVFAIWGSTITLTILMVPYVKHIRLWR